MTYYRYLIKRPSNANYTMSPKLHRKSEKQVLSRREIYIYLKTESVYETIFFWRKISVRV